MGVGNTQITIIVNKALFNASAKSCCDSCSGRHFSTGGVENTPPPPAMLDQKKPGRIRVKNKAIMPYPVKCFRNIKINGANIKRRIAVKCFENCMRDGN